jgi:LPS sulfotransferase NodH
MRNNIVILCEARTGSNFLCELFYCFEPINVLGEFFLESEDKNPVYAFDELQDTNHVIKVINTQISEYNLDFIFNTPNTYYIILERTNKLEQMASLKIAQKLQKWYGVDTSDMKIHIDPTEYENFCMSSIQNYAYLKSKTSGKNVLEINYEDDLLNIDLSKTLSKIHNWLQEHDILLNYTEFIPKYNKKQNNNSIQDMILNYHELCK